MSTFPNNILVKANVVNEVDLYDQEDHNILKNEIIALQTYIGTNPHGDRPNVAARLNAMLNPSGVLISSAGVPQPTIPGFFWYDTAADQMKIIKSDNTIKSVGGSLSNVIFSSVLEQTISSNSGVLLTHQTTLDGTNPGISLNYWVNTVSVGFSDICPRVIWNKIAGVNTLRAQFDFWCTPGGGRTCTVSFGSLTTTDTVSGIASGTTVVERNLSIDVSGFDVGTTYYLFFQARSSSAGADNVYLGKRSIFGE